LHVAAPVVIVAVGPPPLQLLGTLGRELKLGTAFFGV